MTATLPHADLLLAAGLLWLAVAGVCVWRAFRPGQRLAEWSDAEVQRHVTAALTPQTAEEARIAAMVRAHTDALREDDGDQDCWSDYHQRGPRDV